MKQSNLTDEQAQEMLKRLSVHFKEPVLPMSRYCAAFTQWAKCIVELNVNAPDRTWNQGSSYFEHLDTILRDITKSNLLARLLYDGEKFRTRLCPEHRGRWHGGLDQCPHGCSDGANMTGWLPED